jgi:hypothetical protein
VVDNWCMRTSVRDSLCMHFENKKLPLMTVTVYSLIRATREFPWISGGGGGRGGPGTEDIMGPRGGY